MTSRADRVAAIATGIGIGLVAFMVTWTVGARITERIWELPMSAYIAMAAAIVVGIGTSALASRRLLRSVKTRAVQELT